MGDRPSSIARSRQSTLPKQQPTRAALRHASRGQPRLRDRAPGGTPEVHPTVPDRRHRHRAAARSGASARPCRACARTTPSRRTRTGACSRCSSRKAPASRSPRSPSSTCCSSLGVPAAEIFYSNPIKSRDSIAYAAAKGVEWFVVDSADELRRSARDQARRQAVPAHRRPPTSAATGRSPASSAPAPADAREIIALRREARRGPRRADLPRRLAVPQPGELARGAGEGARPVRRDDEGGPQAAPAQYRRRLPGAPRQAHPLDRGDRPAW